MSTQLDNGGRHARVLILGGGFSGIGTSIRLLESGFGDFVVLERADDIGGVWEANTYPGCTCDVPSHLYSFSFAPNPEWSHTFSPQAEIRDYLRRCADAYGVRPHLRTGVDVHEAAWDDSARHWVLATSEGQWTAEVLVSCMGPLTEPRLPDVPGLETFDGPVMHSARWDHAVDLTGLRVASIGTGASAIQYVPEIAGMVGRLFVFQRTAPWVTKHGNRPVTDRERRVFRRFPLAQKAVRAAIYTAREVLVLGFVKQPAVMKVLQRTSEAHMDAQISDPVLRAKVTPTYTMGCKRIVPSNRWYPTLALPTVELVTEGLTEIRQHSVIDAAGMERQVDAIVFGTGYHVGDIPFARHIHGRDDQVLMDAWHESPRSYLGLTVPGFPNLFTMLGPNTGLGHSSMIYMIEAQIEHVMRALRAFHASGAATIEVRPEAYLAYNAMVDAKMAGTVWEVGGCSSWYHDAVGRNSAIWPDWTWRFRRLCKDFDTHAYELAVASEGQPSRIATASDGR